ncbi:MAG: hypothetical protein KJN93_02615 [Alphaproteobacteria bacterium]|nr:hypothetical protein [Alphaproteobacteria bacterium]NNF25297.1 hypothetical protein [Paracoccaceae bacterium]
MTGRRAILASGALLSLAAAALGLKAGLSRQQMTETDAIGRAAAVYVAETGGALTDCIAVPGGREPVWLMVSCGTGQDLRRYAITRNGALIDPGQLPPET